MSKEAVSNFATPTRSAGTPKASAPGEKTSQTEQGLNSAHTQDWIERRAYELYEQRGRQEDRALEDWVKAEQEMIGAASQS